MLPSFEFTDPSQLTADDLAIITRNETQVATNLASNWSYEQRRSAQPILDFLYLGPSAVIRDLDFLRREGITMIIVARDSRMASRQFASVDTAVRELNLASQFFDIQQDQLIQAFSEMIRIINNHLLSKYHEQAHSRHSEGQLLVDPNTFTRGKVLLTCETGNDTSAAIVAAYIMSVFGSDLETTLQYINIQRFCCCFDEDRKRMLKTWEGIVKARSEVARTQQHLQRPTQTRAKRSVDDLLTMDHQADSSMGNSQLDADRFEGRRSFTPFMDAS
jgi:serine/threonine/tyrosine-interacting protein